MELIISARSRRQENTEYRTLDKHMLRADIDVVSGKGTAEDPWQAHILISNEGSKAWSGVIHVELPFKKHQPWFFLPAFMYGRNRGEAPQNVPNEFPRLREGNPSRPSSSWWMVRSDRLSHPAALVYDEGQIFGLSASPYWIKILQVVKGNSGTLGRKGCLYSTVDSHAPLTKAGLDIR